MVVHNELRPDPGLLPLTVAEKAMRLALTAQTRNAGSLYIPNPNGDDLIFGESAEDGANWVDGEGNQSPLVDTEFFEQGIEQANQEITVINGRLDQMDAEADQMQDHIDSVRREAQENFETANATADAAAQKADAASREVADLRTEVGETVQTVKDSVSSVQSDVDAVTRKAADLASELDGTKATVEQVVTEQGEIKSSVSNAVEKADQSLKVSTQASQTATQAQTTATSAYEDAQTAITQSSQATQTANQVSLELKTNYQTKADADAKYATQASLTATSEQIRTEVSETYATQATVNALENLANNAVQTWMGEGVPSLSNKPASDWTTDELRKQHSGDLYYDTNTGYAYRFGSSDGTSYSWALVKDTDITKALADAAKAQETAEGAQSGVNELKTSIPVTYATKSELSQKADSITARVEEVAQAGETTSNKVAELELTADGLQTTVKEQASKIDQNTTTISQVSQKADSLSSTITQVSGRVDDVDTKADAAQGTANSALSQASRVEQNLDSFKTSVSRDYQTKTDALSQKSELEQNINSFKAIVSETYTTKDEFNALEIGGTNLALNTNQASSKWAWQTASGNATKESVDVNGVTAIKLTNNVSSASWQYFSYYSVDVKGMEPDSDYTVSFDILASGFGKSLTIQANLQNGDGTSNIAPNKTLGVISDDAWFTLSAVLHTRSDINPTGQVLYCTGLALVPGASVTLKNLKIEKGNKPTAWSPAPEDFDGKYTSKTEFKQTTDKISATATAASQNASSALSKISSLEVSVDGIDTRVEEVASDADEAVKTASQVSQRVDSLSSTITQVQGDVDSLNASVRLINPSFETGDTTGWKFFGYQQEPYVNNVDPRSGTYRLVFPSINAAGNISLENDAKFPVKAGEVYRISLSVNPDSTITTVSVGLKFSDNSVMNYNPQFSSGWHEYSGTVTIPSGKTEAHFLLGMNVEAGNNVRVDSVLIENISDAKTANDTANSALSKSSSVEQNLNSFKTSVSQTYETKSDASNKQSSLQQSVNNLRTEVSETYTTKTEFNALEIGGTNLLAGTNNGTTGWSGSTNGGKVSITAIHSPSKLVDYPRIEFTDSGSSWRVATYNNASRARTIVANSAGKKFTLSFDAAVTSSNGTNKRIPAFFREGDSTDNLITFGSFSVPNVEVWNHYELTGTSVGGSITNQVIYFDLSTAMAVDGTAFKICNLKLEEGNKATPWSPAPEDLLSTADAAQTYSTKSYVDQTARTVSLGVVEEYKNGQHGSALATASDITAAKDSITSTVSQMYLSKSSASSTYATKTQVQQTSDSLTVKISESIDMVEIGGTNIARDTKAFGRNHVSSTEEGYLRSYVNRTNGTYKGLTVRNIVSSDGTGQAVCEYLVTNVQHSEYYTLSFWAKGSGRIRTYFYGPGSYIGARRVSSSDGQGASGSGDGATNMTLSSGWKRYWVVYQTNSSGGSTTDKYMLLRNDNDMASCDVCGVMIERGNKASEWSASPLDAAAETAAAQSTANTANTNATNANNRVGNLETCIKMTSDGVRVGKISNGNFTGYSALVNSDGSFDILNASGAMSSRFSDSMIELGKNNSTATISMLNGSGSIVTNTNGLDISSPKNVQLTAGGKNSGQTFMVKSDGVYYKNRKIFPPFSVLEKQNYSDITIEAYSYAGFVSVNVRRWNQSGTALFPPAQNRSIIGKINPDYAPKQGIDVLVGIHGNAWLEMSIEPNGNIGIYELYSDSGVNVASFGGLANYLPKNALL